ncbi:OmpA family protein [Psychrobacter sp. DAB_AL62B]|uniref:OmpA family protein n=1 Tax=Psychrobacter sp. DAB_AL62B TaxID=1028420 RepID=UPI002380F620|nr:OmpA family protein [Psychrobacter sp. DAB_AL62B]MDE4455167.1 cell envelope biogenesis protein OmpA [Psychrobacter sp. DAB_AL62B]
MRIKTHSTLLLLAASITLASCQSTPKNTIIDKQVYVLPKVLIEALADTDNDGVPDELDNCPNTPEGVVTDEYGCPVAVNLIGYLTMELRVFFERNSNELQTKYLIELEKVAEKMHSDPELVVVLSGHISEPEAVQIAVDIDGKMNQAKADKRLLGRERAQIIKNALIKRNIARDKIYTFDCADSMPIAPNDTEEGASMNQRIYGKALKADDFYTGSGHEQSLTYYKEFCQQF